MGISHCGLLLIYLIVVASQCCHGNLIDGEEVVHRAVLDPDEKYVMLWSPREDDIVFELQVETRGYFGFGFSPTGGMKGADVVLIWFSEEGHLFLSDRHALGTYTPVEDEVNDYTLIGGYQNATHSVVMFSRPWTTCDVENDMSLSSDTVKVIWSYSKSLPVDGNFPYHDQRGARSLYLLEPRAGLIPTSPDVKHFDVLAPNVFVSSKVDTLYWCWIFHLPPMQKKNHFIGYIPMIEKKSLAFVHHMLIYECQGDRTHETYSKWSGLNGAQCFSPSMPFSWYKCRTPILAWAVGSEGEMLPDHVGIPLHDHHGGATFFMVEMHYDNPFHREFVDNSGLRLFYTPKTREFDGSVMQIGHKVSPIQMIPPNQRWETVAHCSSECTDKMLPRNGVNIFAALLHAHLLGRAITLQHIRKHQELPPVFHDGHYDFNYQQVRVLSEERRLLPGDHLITTCHYDSTDKNEPTYGGEDTRDEMCLVFAFYYPRQDFSRCESYPDPEKIIESFDVKVHDDSEDLVENGDFLLVHAADTPSDAMLLHSMKNRSPGDGAIKIDPSKSFMNVRLKKDNDVRKGTTFYDVLQNKTKWRMNRTINKLKRTMYMSRHENYCTRASTQQNVLKNEDIRNPEFYPWISERVSCVRGSDKNSYITINDDNTSAHKNKVPVVLSHHPSEHSKTMEKEIQIGDNGRVSVIVDHSGHGKVVEKEVRFGQNGGISVVVDPSSHGGVVEKEVNVDDNGVSVVVDHSVHGKIVDKQINFGGKEGVSVVIADDPSGITKTIEKNGVTFVVAEDSSGKTKTIEKNGVTFVVVEESGEDDVNSDSSLTSTSKVFTVLLFHLIILII